jgi:hypothetical protein
MTQATPEALTHATPLCFFLKTAADIAAHLPHLKHADRRRRHVFLHTCVAVRESLRAGNSAGPAAGEHRRGLTGLEPDIAAVFQQLFPHSNRWGEGEGGVSRLEGGGVDGGGVEGGSEAAGREGGGQQEARGGAGGREREEGPIVITLGPREEGDGRTLVVPGEYLC